MLETAVDAKSEELENFVRWWEPGWKAPAVTELESDMAGAIAGIEVRTRRQDCRAYLED